MLLTYFTVALGWTALILGLASMAPQIMRTIRTRDLSGVSWTSRLLSLVCVAVWFLYAMSVNDDIQVINNGIVIVISVALCVLSIIFGRVSWAMTLLLMVGSVAGIWAAWYFFETAGVAVVATVLTIAQRVPQTALSLSGQSLYGLCPWSTLLSVVTSVLWLGYGALMTDPAVFTTSAMLVVLGGIILFRRLPPRQTITQIAHGRLGPIPAKIAYPVARKTLARSGSTAVRV